MPNPENDPPPLLTPREREAVQKAGDLWGDLCAIVGDGPTRDADLAELIVHVHAIQHAVMSQAAGRAYPSEFRLLGSVIPPEAPSGSGAGSPVME